MFTSIKRPNFVLIKDPFPADDECEKIDTYVGKMTTEDLVLFAESGKYAKIAYNSNLYIRGENLCIREAAKRGNTELVDTSASCMSELADRDYDVKLNNDEYITEEHLLAQYHDYFDLTTLMRFKGKSYLYPTIKVNGKDCYKKEKVLGLIELYKKCQGWDNDELHFHCFYL